MDYRYLWRIGKYVLTTMISVCLALYVGYHLINGFSTSVETTLVKAVDDEDTQTLDGYIMRHETLLYATGSGNFNYLREDGDRVGIHDPVAELYSGTESADSSAQLAQIDRRLSLLKNSNLQTGHSYSDTATIDGDINALYYTILSKNRLGDTEAALQKRDELLADLNKRLIVTGQIVNFDTQIAELESRRDQMVKASGNVLQTVEASVSGYYHADIDGFEDIFSADKLDTLTLDGFDAMTSSVSDTSLKTDATGGANAGKVINEFNWYVACEIDISDLRAYNLDTYYYVIFPYNADERIRMKLSKIVQETDDDRIILVFETRQVPENFNFLRRQTIEVVREASSGFKVPATAVRMENGVQGVYILDGYIVYFRPVTTVMEADNYLVVSPVEVQGTIPLSEYDAVIVEGKNLYNGKVIS